MKSVATPDIDGRYGLTVNGDLVTKYGVALDGDSNGTASGDSVFGESTLDGFYRKFGDANGNDVVVNSTRKLGLAV